MRKILIAFTSLLLTCSFTACNEFVFGRINVPDEENPLLNKKTPQSGADLFFNNTDHPLVKETENLANPDPNGAFANWATCLVMFKEGHPHGGNILHGNYVYGKGPWRQEEFAVIRNTPNGPKLEIAPESILTFYELSQGKKSIDYFRLVGGHTKLWALCLFFYDKEGNLINDKVYEQSDEYQIFFYISDKDSNGNPYNVMDIRFLTDEHGNKYKIDSASDITEELMKKHKAKPSKFFSDKPSEEERMKYSPEVFTYCYRDTWKFGDMNDGVRELYNLRLLPPYTRDNYWDVYDGDVDYVGLKGHLKFDQKYDRDGLDVSKEGYEWPLNKVMQEKADRTYTRDMNLLPQFYLAVSVRKCPKGKKALDDPMSEEGYQLALGKHKCAEAHAPNPNSEWKEIIRFNLPVKIYTSAIDSDPTNPNPYEPYYFHLAIELGLTPTQAYEATESIMAHGSATFGALGFGSWFL